MAGRSRAYVPQDEAIEQILADGEKIEADAADDADRRTGPGRGPAPRKVQVMSTLQFDTVRMLDEIATLRNQRRAAVIEALIRLAYEQETTSPGVPASASAHVTRKERATS